GSRRTPMPQRCPFDLIRPERTHRSCRRDSPSARGPMLPPAFVFDLSGSHGAAIVQVDSHPIPLHGRIVEQSTRPFVIEPCGTAHAITRIFDPHFTRRLELRQAVVVARVARIRALLTEAVVALKNRRLHGTELELDRKVRRRNRRALDFPLLAQRPLVDAHIEPPLRCLRQPETCTGRPLGAQQTTAHRIADRGMPKEPLSRGEARRIPLVDSRSIAEERHLKTALDALSIGEPTRDIPPLGAKRGMTAFIFRKRDRISGYDVRVFGLARMNERGPDDKQNARTKRARAKQRPARGRVIHTCRDAHQSSFTARITSFVIARRPLHTAIEAELATSTSVSAASRAPGACRSMLQ